MGNIFFNNFNNSGEQGLVEDLIIESIGIYGLGVFYCPRTLVAKDDIYGEDTLSTYNNAYPIDMFVKNVDNYEGDGTFLSKFNLEIRDQMTFTIARRTFANEIITQQPDLARPQEGDLIYSEMMNRIFVIKYVNNSPIFYAMGALQTYDLTCEVFEYSSERFNTGIAAIDAIETSYSVDTESGAIVFEDQNIDVFADNEELDTEGNDLIDWSERDPFSEAIT
jgi:hypothetical protein